jgi:hypothetical protein
MKKTLVLILTAFSLTACADATRTIPVLSIEQRSINIVEKEQYRERQYLVVPVDRKYLPPPVEPKPLPQAKLLLPKHYKDPVIENWKKNNYIR